MQTILMFVTIVGSFCCFGLMKVAAQSDSTTAKLAAVAFAVVTLAAGFGAFGNLGM